MLFKLSMQGTVHFSLTVFAFAFSQWLTTTSPYSEFHLVVIRRAWRTRKKALGHNPRAL